MLSPKQLVELGFTEKEAMVYLALLEMGPSTVSEIGRQAKINRTTGYDIVEMLCSKGLANALGEGTIKKYTVEDPEKIIAFSQSKFQEAQAQFEASKKLLPELKSIFQKIEKPKVKFYEGINGLKEVYEETLTAKEPLIGYGSAEPYFETMQNFGENYLKRRVAKGIHGRFIAPNTSQTQERARNDKAELRETRLVPKEKLNIEIEVNIFDNKIIMASFKEGLGIIIESQKIADAQKKIFELAWEGAEKYQK
ncbi:MAG: helix-turn-helix domain-containing protein [Candidatus Pacebacteria bacterium]|nr:helix-turn-helix domain-containing protein [Candidatus Paceibacterota bacterium]